MAGLKENVILGKLIPAGTGFEALKHVDVEPTQEAKVEFEKNNGFAAQMLDPFDDAYGYSDFNYFDLGAGYGAF